jgi:hypothetical protein
MGDKSILDQILTNISAEEVAKLNAPEITSSLINELSVRERDILAKRFGLINNENYTLENIGKLYNLTRERIRQIERSAVKKLRLMENLEEYVGGLKKVINSLIEEHGGLIEREHLLENLINFSLDGARARENDKQVHRNHFIFLLAKILFDEYEELNDSEIFKKSFKFKHASTEHLEEFARELVEKLKEAKNIKPTSELLELAKDLESYKKYKEKFDLPADLDISASLENDLFEEDAESVNKNKPIYSILKLAKRIAQNKFGHWGLKEWREIVPKTVNDKAYIILKNNGRPMHFAEISKKINEIKFDCKISNPASVHNELILDDKYILVGRGLYTLKEFGYDKGTVADVIEQILKEVDRPLSRDEIVNKVLEKRVVQKATIILSLTRNEKFEKLSDNKFVLKNLG